MKKVARFKNIPENGNNLTNKWYDVIGEVDGYIELKEVDGGYYNWRFEIKEVLPEEYVVECNFAEESSEVIHVFDPTYCKTVGNWKYVIKSPSLRRGWDFSNSLIGYSMMEVIPFSKWKEVQSGDNIKPENMEKKIVGYNLINPANEAVVRAALGGYKEKYKTFFVSGNIGGCYIQKCKELGIMHWFKPVYEEELKAGDWIYFLDSFDDKPVGYTTQITEIEIENNYNNSKGWIKYKNGGFRWEGIGYFIGKHFRKATGEEIKGAKKIVVGNYIMETAEHDATMKMAKFGCQSFYPGEINAYKHFLSSSCSARMSIFGTEITMELLNGILSKLE